MGNDVLPKKVRLAIILTLLLLLMKAETYATTDLTMTKDAGSEDVIYTTCQSEEYQESMIFKM